METKKQTAVEWLVSQQKHGHLFFDEIIEKAKEMEKQAIVDAYNQGYRYGEIDGVGLGPDGYDVADFSNAEDYYNETFKSE